MNSSLATNAGGCPATAMRTYANGEFFNKLPEELRNVIIDTKVVSGYGFNDKNPNRTDANWEVTDQIYLLSAHEVWIDKVTSVSIIPAPSVTVMLTRTMALPQLSVLESSYLI